MKKNIYNKHGIISISLFLIAPGIGIAATAIYSVLISLIGLLTIVFAFTTISIVYCSKCKCRENCNHWIFGKISILLSKYKDGKYTKNDLVAGTIIPMLIMIVLPQYWLLKSPLLLISYWGIIAIAGLEVYFFVCNKCLNNKCTLCRNKMEVEKI